MSNFMSFDDNANDVLYKRYVFGETPKYPFEVVEIDGEDMFMPESMSRSGTVRAILTEVGVEDLVVCMDRTSPEVYTTVATGKFGCENVGFRLQEGLKHTLSLLEDFSAMSHKRHSEQKVVRYGMNTLCLSDFDGGPYSVTPLPTHRSGFGHRYVASNGRAIVCQPAVHCVSSGGDIIGVDWDFTVFDKDGKPVSSTTVVTFPKTQTVREHTSQLAKALRKIKAPFAITLFRPISFRI